MSDSALGAIRAELREARLRGEQRDAAYQATIEILTRQMAQMEAAISARLTRLETLLTDIARKLDA